MLRAVSFEASISKLNIYSITPKKGEATLVLRLANYENYS